MFGPTGEGPAMRRASASGDPGAGAGGAGRLTYSKGPWTSASGSAGELRTRAETSRSALGRGHEGVAAGAVGLSSVAALKGVLTSWEERLRAVRDECEQLKGNLLTVAREMGESETAVTSSVRGVHVPGPADGER
ncbi:MULTISPECIES: hypothetical protein [Streptomyces]|uniref:Uncharacterized protein n=1 Tax=Streptomyces griseus subsp. griseus (strain JCM 4626 / CBS 651.72 / NBRC 13350 / KCC S-0626 / ISP 5235) TaxID=455632 RepID=B1VKU4_STRGG|nr:hypothetical protein [Streptomyces griseus]KUJ64053.1 hypothetical protein ACZ90_62685 [Streptomyces albus subsp. albus]BAG19972.1 conserved hypothetical protein [Streptomyces griseus subsp. griseus NBRC 13350]